MLDELYLHGPSYEIAKNLLNNASSRARLQQRPLSFSLEFTQQSRSKSIFNCWVAAEKKRHEQTIKHLACCQLETECLREVNK